MNGSVDNSSERSPISPGFPLVSILFLMIMFFFNFLPRLILAPLMVTVEQDLHLGHGDAGTFFLLISSGYCIGVLLSGFLSSRISHHKTIVIANCAVGCVLLFISTSNSLILMKFELFLLGIAAGPYFPSGIATIPTLVSSNHQGKAVSIHELAVSLSFVSAPIIAELFLRTWTWRDLLASIGVFAILLSIFFLMFGKGGRNRGEAPSLKNIRLLIRDRSFQIMVFLFVLGMGSGIGLYTMMPLYLVSERFFERGWANALVSLSRVPGLLTVLVAGFVLDRLGIKKTLIVILSLAGILTISLGTVPNQAVATALFLQYMVSVCFFPAGWMAISRLGNPCARNIAIQLAVPIAYIFGAGFLPAGIGLAGEYSSFSLAIVFFGVLMIVGGILSKFLVVTEHIPS